MLKISVRLHRVKRPFRNAPHAQLPGYELQMDMSSVRIAMSVYRAYEDHRTANEKKKNMGEDAQSDSTHR